jgi:predicted phage tail protein
MITIVLIKNPFNPSDGREVHQIEYEEGKKVSEYAETFLTDYENYSVRAKTYVVDDRYIPKDGDFIVIAPTVGRHKNPLVIVAAIALSVVSMGVGSVAAGGSFMSLGSGLMAATGWSAIYGYLAAAAVMALGGSLIQRAFGTADLNNSSTSDPTYSWSGISSTTGQGYAVPITYGTVKSGGQILSEYVLNDSDKQYLYRLYSAGQGPLTISDVKINSNPAGQYEKVYIDTRNGTNNQEVIKNFNDTISEKALSYELDDNVWRSDVVTGTATEGIIVSLEASNGLYYTKDNGDLSQAWVEVAIQYRPYGSTSDNDWISLLSNQFKVGSTTFSGLDISLFSQQGISAGTYDADIKVGFGYIKATIGEWSGYGESGSISCGPFTIKATLASMGEKTGTVTVVAGNAIDSVKIYGSQTSAVRQDFRIDNVPAGEYEVRAKVLSRSSAITLSRASTRIWWTALAGIVYDDFIYPGIALLGMKGLATDQLSGSPTITFLKTRDTVEVWNPYTMMYEGKDATNPAWASYDFIHQCYLVERLNPSTGKYDYPSPTFTRSSVATDAEGNKVASNVPRFTADGLMIEEGTTNIKSDPSFTAGIADWENQATTMEWDKTIGRTDNYSMHVVGGGSMSRVYFTQKISAGEQLAFSCYIKSAGTPRAHMEYDGGDYFWKQFDGNHTSGVGKWERSYVVGEVATSDTVAFCFVDTIDGGYDAWIDDIQVEKKSYATSYINGTRAAEALTVPASVFPTAEGTLEFTVIPKVIANYNTYFPFAGSWGNFSIFLNSTYGHAYWDYGNSTNNGDNFDIGAVTANTPLKISLSWSASSGKRIAVVNGVSYTSTGWSVPNGLTLPSTISPISNYSSDIKNIRFSNTAHTADKMIADAQLGQLPVESDTTCYMSLDRTLFAEGSAM